MNTPHLSLDLFTQVASDFEKRQYLILAGLKKIEDQFYQNKIYPDLMHLVKLFKSLKEIKQKLEDLRKEFPKKIKNVDLVNKKIEYEIVFVDGSDINQVEDLIEWALPHIERVLQAGVTIHEFVESDLSVEHVGIVPNYREEGYFFIPDRAKNKLKLYQFELTIFKSAEDKYRSLKTQYMKSLKTGMARISPNSIKLDLIREKKDLPNPATYNFDTNLDFPFNETIFPVAKRKLMQKIFESK
ncbi:MAG: hypothetical protein ACFCU6_06825 [Balneolaceae bacterium]